MLLGGHYEHNIIKIKKQILAGQATPKNINEPSQFMFTEAFKP